MTAHTFSTDAFKLFVTMRSRVGRKLTVTEAAAEAGVSRPQMFRAMRGQPVNNLAFLSLCLWMNINPYAFLLDAETGRGLARLPDAEVSREAATETRRAPRIARAA